MKIKDFVNDWWSFMQELCGFGFCGSEVKNSVLVQTRFHVQMCECFCSLSVSNFSALCKKSCPSTAGRISHLAVHKQTPCQGLTGGTALRQVWGNSWRLRGALIREDISSDRESWMQMRGSPSVGVKWFIEVIFLFQTYRGFFISFIEVEVDHFVFLLLRRGC